MTELLIQIGVESFSTDDELDLDRLTADLEAELSEIGEVSRVAGEPAPGDKGAGELVPAVLNVLTSIDLPQIEAMIRLLTGFAKRNDNRRVSVRIGRDKITVDGASEQQADDLVAAFLMAVERQRR